jgi:hypothetical protein
MTFDRALPGFLFARSINQLETKKQFNTSVREKTY